jgi:hypothetical protein
MRAVLHNPSPSIQRRQAPIRSWLAGFAAAILLAALTMGTATAARPAANDPAALGLVVTAPRMGTAVQEPCAPVDLRYPDGKPIDLTGAWRADDGALYYLRQVGSCLWWAGLSEGATYATAAHPFWPQRWGLTFTNIFQGTISPGFSITGQWADVPRGIVLSTGTLQLDITAWYSGGRDFIELDRRSATGGFGASRWTPGGPPLTIGVPCKVYLGSDTVCRYRQVGRNDQYPMGSPDGDGRGDGHLRIYKDNVAVFGHVTGEGFTGGFPVDNPSYQQFMCPVEAGLWPSYDDDPPDGDLNFHLQADRARLDAQPGFWTNGWFNSSDDIRDKLDYHQANHLHAEIVAYGRPSIRDECSRSRQPLLPGWMEQGGSSVLLNGRPINGRVTQTTSPVTMLGRTLLQGALVRVTGMLGLDCAHHFFDPCSDDDPEEQNVELHPVYSVDVVQNFHLPRPAADLTGVWAADDVGTYYVRQLGSAVWWLGLSVDQGGVFTNVFHGTLLPDGTLQGSWADVPLGVASNSGELRLVTGPAGFGDPQATQLTRTSATGGFGGATWDKLYDVGLPNIVGLPPSTELFGERPKPGPPPSPTKSRLACVTMSDAFGGCGHVDKD